RLFTLPFLPGQQLPLKLGEHLVGGPLLLGGGVVAEHGFGRHVEGGRGPLGVDLRLGRARDEAAARTVMIRPSVKKVPDPGWLSSRPACQSGHPGQPGPRPPLLRKGGWRCRSLDNAQTWPDSCLGFLSRRRWCTVVSKACSAASLPNGAHRGFPLLDRR